MAKHRANLVVANWKMNPLSAEEARSLVSKVELGLLALNRNGVETVICPPYIFLPALRHAAHFAKLGAQNVSAEEQGPFTGEISISQILPFGISHVILGHSERRALGEDDKFINRKLRLMLRKGVEPVLCVGYGTKKGSSLATIIKVIDKQLQGGLAALNPKKTRLTVAYEPVWAISKGLGTGHAVTPKHAAAVLEFVQKRLPRARLIYGGSLNGDNAATFAETKVIQGGLVGGASLDALEFLKIVRSFSPNY